MIEIGSFTELEIVKEVEFGLYLDGGPFGEILLPNNAVPKDAKIGDDLNVFIYCDSEDRIIATTATPTVIVGDFAFLEVKDVGEYGAFLNWLMAKDLFVPFREMQEPMQVGKKYLVRAYLDEKSDRIAASSKLSRFIENESSDLNKGDEVNIIVAAKTALGYKVIVNKQFWGVVYSNEVFKAINVGDKMTAFIKNVRDDQRLDITLTKQGYQKQIPTDVATLLDKLQSADGFIPFTDKSDPAVIKSNFNMSKKAFKRAVGFLYKERKIILEKGGIRLKK